MIDNPIELSFIHNIIIPNIKMNKNWIEAKKYYDESRVFNYRELTEDDFLDFYCEYEAYYYSEFFTNLENIYQKMGKEKSYLIVDKVFNKLNNCEKKDFCNELFYKHKTKFEIITPTIKKYLNESNLIRDFKIQKTIINNISKQNLNFYSDKQIYNLLKEVMSYMIHDNKYSKYKYIELESLSYIYNKFNYMIDDDFTNYISDLAIKIVSCLTITNISIKSIIELMKIEKVKDYIVELKLKTGFDPYSTSLKYNSCSISLDENNYILSTGSLNSTSDSSCSILIDDIFFRAKRRQNNEE